MEKVLRVTIDTNILQEYWKKRSKYKVVEKLLSLTGDGKIDLAVTSRIREDIPKLPLADKINTLKEINITETGSITRLDFWVLGRDMFCDDAMKKYWEDIQQNASESGVEIPDWRDQDHIHAHYVQNRDVFLTWDKAVLKLSKDLKKVFGISVMSPERFLLNMDSG